MSDSLTPDDLVARIKSRLLCFWTTSDAELQARGLLAEAYREIEQLRRGEFICKNCGIRKDGEVDGQPDF